MEKMNGNDTCEDVDAHSVLPNANHINGIVSLS